MCDLKARSRPRITTQNNENANGMRIYSRGGGSGRFRSSVGSNGRRRRRTTSQSADGLAGDSTVGGWAGDSTVGGWAGDSTVGGGAGDSTVGGGSSGNGAAIQPGGSEYRRRKAKAAIQPDRSEYGRWRQRLSGGCGRTELVERGEQFGKRRIQMRGDRGRARRAARRR